MLIDTGIEINAPVLLPITPIGCAGESGPPYLVLVCHDQSVKPNTL